MITSIKLIRSYNCYKEYDQISDETLVDLAKNGNQDAEKCIYIRYCGSVKRIVGYFFVAGGDKDDLFQEAMIGLFKAIKKYNPDNSTLFKTYAELCMKRQIISAIRKSKRYKNAPLNEYTSLYSDLNDDDDDKRCMIDKYSLDSSLNPEILMEQKESGKRFNELIEIILSEFEKEVLSKQLDGKTYRETAITLQKDVKSVDNAVQRIKKKLSKYVEKFEI